MMNDISTTCLFHNLMCLFAHIINNTRYRRKQKTAQRHRFFKKEVLYELDITPSFGYISYVIKKVKNLYLWIDGKTLFVV